MAVASAGASAAGLAANTAPTAERIVELKLDTSLAAVLKFAGVPDEAAAKFGAQIGCDLATAHPGGMAVIPDEMFNAEAMKHDGPFSEKGSIMLAHRLCKHICLAQPCTEPGSARPSGTSTVEVKASDLTLTRKVKMSNVLDPIDDMEFQSARATQVDEWFANYVTVKRGPPLVDSEPTVDQVSAMYTRVVLLGSEPYADFSVLTPFGRRMAKQLRHRSWLPQEDGSYIPVQVPGPPSLTAWEACFCVYEVILLMLRFQSGQEVVTPIALETYGQHFKKLARTHTESWHLCQHAEDRCRSEHMPRLRREMLRKTGVDPTWSEVFIAAAMDKRYWDEEVRDPAILFLARHGRKRAQDDPETPGPKATRVSDSPAAVG